MTPNHSSVHLLPIHSFIPHFHASSLSPLSSGLLWLSLVLSHSLAHVYGNSFSTTICFNLSYKTSSLFIRVTWVFSPHSCLTALLFLPISIFSQCAYHVLYFPASFHWLLILASSVFTTEPSTVFLTGRCGLLVNMVFFSFDLFV